MYCSSCGVAIAQGLSYCNYCGAKLNRDDGVAESSEVKAETLVQLMVIVFVLGLIGIIVLMGVMKAVLGLPADLVLAFSLLPFLFMLGLEGVFIRLLFRRKRAVEETSYRGVSKEQVTNELDAATARVLPEAQALAEPVPSVTEHTTRAFDPVYTDRRER